MADTALRVFSFHGLLAEKIGAINIKSRADARKRGPFMGENNDLLLWVNWTRRDAAVRRRPYFRQYPASSGGERAFARQLQTEITQRETARSESPIHKKAKEALGACLKKLVADGRSVPWCYKDDQASDFPISGNLLSDVKEVVVDTYSLKMPFGMTYRPDVALLGDKIKNQRVFLGAIELELSHEAELLKCLLCKATGAPLMSMDLHGADENDITEEWCLARLTETTTDSADGLRRNYVYLHNMLYSVFSDAPLDLLEDNQHQFVIFVSDDDIKKLWDWLLELQKSLGLSDADVRLQKVRLNPKEKTSVAMFENEGSIAGPSWREHNDHQYLRVTLTRPQPKSGPLYRYHLVLVNLLTLHFDALVGYKVGHGEKNYDSANPIWVRKKDSSSSVMGINSMVSLTCRRRSRAWRFDTHWSDSLGLCAGSPRTGC